MSNIRFLCAVALSWILASATGCREDNPYYCDDRAYDNCVNRPGEFPCSEKADCAEQAGKPACSELNEGTGTGICVQCTVADSAACAGVTPICGADATCKGCGKHGDCASAVCLADGSCAAEATVAYVSPTGTDNDQCGKSTPCTKVAKAIATSRPYVKFSETTDEAISLENKNVTFVAEPGAKLTRTNNGILLEVKGSSQLEIFDLELTGASGPSGIGISLPVGNTARLSLQRAKVTNNNGGGIVINGGVLTISQSTISGNAGGGISISSATFDITNNFIYRNGNSTGTTIGGVSFAVAAAGSNRFEFNTIVDNEISASTTSSGGVLCDIPGFAASNNIIARNFVNRMSAAANANTLGQCTHPSSKMVADLGELKFLAPDMPPFNYRVGAGSSAIDQATTPSPIVVDVDGDARPQGAQKDIGADEYKAN